MFGQGIGDVLLRPAMRLALFSTSQLWAAVPHPQTRARMHAPGVDTDRVLLYGSGPLMGYGVLNHELSFTGALARELSAITTRGIDVDLVADFDCTIASALPSLAEIRLARYDSVVLAIGMNDAVAHTPVSRWRRHGTELLRMVSESVAASSQVFVLGIHPANDADLVSWPLDRIVERHAIRLNAALKEICETLPNVTYLDFAMLPSLLGKRQATASIPHRSAETYTRWAKAVAPRIASDLRRWVDEETDDIRDDCNEVTRQRALDALRILDTKPEERFDRVVRLAQQLFGSHAASLGFVDHDRVWFKSRIGFDEREISRARSFSDLTMRRDATLVIEDTLADQLHREHLEASQGVIRFYIGHPIESPQGERVGALSIFGAQPRAVTKAERALVRDLALLIEQELQQPSQSGN